MKMRRRLSLAIAGAWLLLAAGPVLAHHSFAAEYDENSWSAEGHVTKGG